MNANEIEVYFQPEFDSEFNGLKTNLINFIDGLNVELNAILSLIGEKTHEVDGQMLFNYLEHVHNTHSKYEVDIKNPNYHQGGVFHEAYIQGSNFKLYVGDTYELKVGDVANPFEVLELSSQMKDIQVQIKLVENVNKKVDELFGFHSLKANEYRNLINQHRDAVRNITKAYKCKYITKFIELHGCNLKCKPFTFDNHLTGRNVKINDSFTIKDVQLDASIIKKGSIQYPIDNASLWYHIKKHVC